MHVEPEIKFDGTDGDAKIEFKLHIRIVRRDREAGKNITAADRNIWTSIKLL